MLRKEQKLKPCFLRAVVVLISVLCHATFGIAQEETESRSRLGQVVACINQADKTVRNVFLIEGFEDQSANALAERKGAVAEMNAGLKGLKIEKILQSTEHRILAHCKSTNGSIVEVYLELSETPPFQIKNIELDVIKSVVSKGKFEDVTELPDNDLGKRITKLIKIVNGNDEGAVREFLESETTYKGNEIETGIRTLSDAFSKSGGFVFHSIRKYTVVDLKAPVVVIAKAKMEDSWHAIVVKVSPNGMFEQIKFAEARAPKSAKSKSMISRSKVIDLVNQCIDRFQEAGEFSGAILVAQNDEILVHRAMGLASRRFDFPNNIETKFNLASMNKMFTSVAVCQLIESGKLSLDDTVDRFLSPQWLSKEIGSKIKIRQLLTHTSGIGTYVDNPPNNIASDAFSELSDFRVLFEKERFSLFEPGAAYRYSNTGMFLLGVVIEKVSGETYFDYVRKHIYEPAKMTNSDSYPMDLPIRNLAIGYYERNGKQLNNMYTLYRGGPAGGGYSTTGDLLKFSRALTQYKLLSRELTNLATTAKPELNSLNYGFGFQIGGDEDFRAFGHSGGSDGINNRMDILPEQEITIVVLSNVDEPAQKVASAIRKIARRIEK